MYNLFCGCFSNSNSEYVERLITNSYHSNTIVDEISNSESFACSGWLNETRISYSNETESPKDKINVSYSNKDKSPNDETNITYSNKDKSPNDETNITYFNKGKNPCDQTVINLPNGNIRIYTHKIFRDSSNKAKHKKNIIGYVNTNSTYKIFKAYKKNFEKETSGIFFPIGHEISMKKPPQRLICEALKAIKRESFFNEFMPEDKHLNLDYHAYLILQTFFAKRFSRGQKVVFATDFNYFIKEYISNVIVLNISIKSINKIIRRHKIEFLKKNDSNQYGMPFIRTDVLMDAKSVQKIQESLMVRVEAINAYFMKSRINVERSKSMSTNLLNLMDAEVLEFIDLNKFKLMDAAGLKTSLEELKRGAVELTRLFKQIKYITD